jgi:hypothetical protein
MITTSAAGRKVHSVNYIAAIKEYLKARTTIDDLDHEQQLLLAYLVFLVKANGTSSVGYAELQRLRYSPKTISKTIKRFKELGIISKVDIGHGNRFSKVGKVSTYHFDLDAILRLVTQSTGFPVGEEARPSVETSRGVVETSRGGCRDFPKGSEPLPPEGRLPEVLLPKQINPEELSPERDTETSGSVFVESNGVFVPCWWPTYIINGLPRAEINQQVIIPSAVDHDHCPCGGRWIPSYQTKPELKRLPDVCRQCKARKVEAK